MTLERRVTEDDLLLVLFCAITGITSLSARKVPKMASSKLKNLSFVLFLLLLGFGGPITAQGISNTTRETGCFPTTFSSYSESCSARGCGDLDFDFDCQCNADCFYYENCCGDYIEECGSTCQGRCGDCE